MKILDLITKYLLPLLLIAVAGAWASDFHDFLRMATLLLVACYILQHVRVPVSIFWTLWNGLLYCAIAGGTFFIGNYKESMTTAEQHLFYVAIGVQVCNALKSFTDTSLSKFLSLAPQQPQQPAAIGAAAENAASKTQAS